MTILNDRHKEAIMSFRKYEDILAVARTKGFGVELSNCTGCIDEVNQIVSEQTKFT